MKLKCPHCFQICEFTPVEMRNVFLTCKYCARAFRANETSPITSEDFKEGSVEQALKYAYRTVQSQRTTLSQQEMKMVADLNQQGTQLYRQGQMTEAIKKFDESLRIRPDQPRVKKIVEEDPAFIID